MLAIVLGLYLWFCLWILPAILWNLLRSIDRPNPGADAIPPAERTLAEQRSAELLRDLLEEREYQQLIQYGYIDVPSRVYKGRLYRIPYNPGRVCILQGGRALAELCVQPIAPLPDNDMVVLHKLMIEGNEQDYLACANAFPVTFPLEIRCL